ncbi:MAG: DNA repair protein RecN [Thermoanaerobaculaceae bacterium]|nr:DNA repair protein RecN [Thermoanaerobaculaceae bacterium]
MISRLFVKNYALVENLELNFEEKFVVLTGETGAGKSLLIGALSTLLGSKFDASLLLRKGEECVIEGTFISEKNKINALGLEDNEPLILKRKFDKEGKSWAFLNGETISLSKLKTIAENLIEINGQHQGAKLLDEENHLKIIDSLKELKTLSSETASLSREIKEQCKLLKLAEGKMSEITRKIELLQAEAIEIEKINPKENEDEELKSRKKALENRSKILENLTSIIFQLKTSDNSILAALKEVNKKAEDLSQYIPSWKDLAKEIEISRAALAEIYSLAEREIESLDFKPDELEKIQERLYQIEKLQRKFGPTLNDVLSHYEAISAELKQLKKTNFDKYEIRKKVDELYDKYIAVAKKLSKARNEKAKAFSQKVSSILKHLALEKGRFEVMFSPLRIESAEDVSEKGLEEAYFLFSANEGEPLLPLSKIASGGELSRVMLAILSSAKGDSLERTVIFDEIDSGIGGKPAEKVGVYLHNLSLSNQVICVTHLPQIASYADQHIKIIKSDKEGRTFVTGRVLSEEERIEEIGRMVAGEKITKSAVEHAKELLKIADETKIKSRIT